MTEDDCDGNKKSSKFVFCEKLGTGRLPTTPVSHGNAARLCPRSFQLVPVAVTCAMTYREIRNVTEMLRALAFPRLVSIENFRTPNFKLVAEILEWVAHRFDPTARLSFNLENQGERVLFIKTVVLLLLQRARVRLNPRKLYQVSDGHKSWQCGTNR
uniref:Calponin-homology (CH) domain-containing protein n=1 Tax=Steinernema glaseri TaxID=37863 RepID=A0A1I7YFV1_9BILA